MRYASGLETTQAQNAWQQKELQQSGKMMRPMNMCSKDAQKTDCQSKQLKDKLLITLVMCNAFRDRMIIMQRSAADIIRQSVDSEFHAYFDIIHRQQQYLIERNSECEGVNDPSLRSKLICQSCAIPISRGSALARCRGFGTCGWKGVGTPQIPKACSRRCRAGTGPRSTR